MWLFASGGLVLPALLPEKVLAEAKTEDIKEAVERGWELQVRGRVVKHLEWFADNYMEAGKFSAIYESPDKDYNCRFYTTREDYGNALKKMALEIDYTKFKDTSLRYPWGQKYHDLLLSIWSMSTRLAPAGGFYGAWSQANPRGYKPTKYATAKGSKSQAQRDRDLVHEPAPFDYDGSPYSLDWLDQFSDDEIGQMSWADWEAREMDREDELSREFQIERARLQEQRSRSARRRANRRAKKNRKEQA